MLPPSGPIWYQAMEAVIGVVQFLIAIAMFAGYRKAGAWAGLRSRWIRKSTLGVRPDNCRHAGHSFRQGV